jgi:hypothetical protein
VPTNVIAGRRSLVVLFAVFAMVIALLALPVAPANAAVTAACPATIPSAGFTDIGGLSADAIGSINCIAFYNISKGTSATTYDPQGNVTRWQMALFLTRQATAHGVTLPSGAAQGFTDLAGLSAEATTAVNQLKQLEITTGTTATTYDPFGNVGRWQMALFLTRLLDKAGVLLTPGADQGFTDLTGLSAAATTAVNQLKELAISTGTSATTFDPFANVSRWQMALFLARTLQAGGVTPSGVISVTPTAAAELNLTGASVTRAYTVSVQGASTVTIELWPASEIASDNKFKAATPGAAGATIDVVNGVGTGAVTKVTGVNVSSGSATFTLKATAVNAGVIPVVYVGTSVTGIAAATAATPVAATNAGIGFGGAMSVIQEGAAATFSGAITAVNKTVKSFVVGGFTYFYDANDTFKNAGVPVTLANFEKELSSGDNILAGSVYAADPAPSSIFDLSDIAPAAPTAALVSTTDTTAKFTYTVAAGATSVNVYRAADGVTPVLVKVIAATTDDDTVLAGLQFVNTGLSAGTIYDYAFSQVVDGEEGAKVLVNDVTTAAASQAVAITAIDVQEVNDGAGTWTILTVTLDKAVSAAAFASFSINPTAQPGLVFTATAATLDTSKIVRVTFGTAQNDTTPDTNWTLKMATGAVTVIGPPAGASTATSSAFAH